MTAALPQPVLVGDPPLHAMLFLPEGQPRAAVVLVPPLFEEQRCAHRALHVAAGALAASGAAVLHINLTATGNSAGSLAEVTIDRWHADVRAAAAFLRERTDVPLTFLGCRAGALLAATAGIAADLLLLQPVTAGKEYLRQTRTRRAIQDKLTGSAVPVEPDELEGQVLSAALTDGLEALRMPEAPPGHVRLLQCSFNDRLLVEYAALQAQWPAMTVRAVVQEPFWLPHTPGTYAVLAEALAAEVPA
jgi:hypothetical protein